MFFLPARSTAENWNDLPVRARGRGEPKKINGSKNLTFPLWWAMQDLNLRPLQCECSTLTTELITRLDKNSKFLQYSQTKKERVNAPF